MRESDTYMMILEEGHLEEAKKLLLRLGWRKFDAPDEGVKSAIDAMMDVEQIERIVDRLFDAANWQELLDTP